MPITTPFEGFATIVKLDYGHKDPEHSLIVVPDRWSDLVEILELPYEYLRKARQTFEMDSTAVDHYWDVYGPLTIILDPLTVPSRTSAEGLRILSIAAKQREHQYTAVAQKLELLIPSWQTLSHQQWRAAVLDACIPVSPTPPPPPHAKAPPPVVYARPGFFVVEYAFVTRVMVIRYVPPDTPTTYFRDNITPITFSDFLISLSGGKSPREAFMHFDLIGASDPTYTSANVASMKAQFAADYVTDPIGTLQGVALPAAQRISFGQTSPPLAYHYTASDFGRSENKNRPVSIQAPSDATQVKLNQFDFLGTSNEPLFERINGDFDPTVILESVDPWASDWVWTHRPCENPYNIDGRFPMDGKHQDFPHATSNGDDSPQPCALIYVTFADGSGRWVIDPSSLLLKNYFAPTIPE